MAEADRPHPPGEAVRTAQGRFAVRLQLRRPQLDAAAQVNGPNSGARPQAAVRLKAAGELETILQNPLKAA